MASFASIQELFESYKKWVVTNPNLVTDVETLAKWTSYFFAGKINKSHVVSEFVYSLSNLFVLYNDTLIMISRNEYGKNKSRENLKYWMTVLHFSEVFIEMTVRSKWGNKGKWSAATVLQIVKCVSNLILIYKYREVPVHHPAMPALRRKQITENNAFEESDGFTLKRSKRVVRRVEGAPPAVLRSWRPLEAPAAAAACAGDVQRQRLAETLYVMKPLLHLGSVACFGSQTWMQWMTALSIDLASFHLYDDQLNSLNYEQRVEISRRKLSLLYYLIRSPMYNNHSRKIIHKLLTGTAKRIPLMGFICHPILQYISIWQDTYFYMWAN